jgi:hypothetical protein
MKKAVEWGDAIYTGLFYQDHDSSALGDREPVLDQGGPLSQRPMGLSDDQAQKIIGRHDVTRARPARGRPGSWVDYRLRDMRNPATVLAATVNFILDRFPYLDHIGK